MGAKREKNAVCVGGGKTVLLILDLFQFGDSRWSGTPHNVGVCKWHGDRGGGGFVVFKWHCSWVSPNTFIFLPDVEYFRTPRIGFQKYLEMTRAHFSHYKKECIKVSLFYFLETVWLMPNNPLFRVFIMIFRIITRQYPLSERLIKFQNNISAIWSAPKCSIWTSLIC